MSRGHHGGVVINSSSHRNYLSWAFHYILWNDIVTANYKCYPSKLLLFLNLCTINYISNGVIGDKDSDELLDSSQFLEQSESQLALLILVK